MLARWLGYFVGKHVTIVSPCLDVNLVERLNDSPTIFFGWKITEILFCLSFVEMKYKMIGNTKSVQIPWHGDRADSGVMFNTLNYQEDSIL